MVQTKKQHREWMREWRKKNERKETQKRILGVKCRVNLLDLLKEASDARNS